jgi:hypothetical protein
MEILEPSKYVGGLSISILNRLFIYSLIHLFIYSFIRLFIYLFIYTTWTEQVFVLPLYFTERSEYILAHTLQVLLRTKLYLHISPHILQASTMAQQSPKLQRK